MKKWISDYDLIERWKICDIDLIEIMLEKDLKAYYSRDLSPVNIDADQEFKDHVTFLMGKLGIMCTALSLGPDIEAKKTEFKQSFPQRLRDDVGCFLFKIKDVEVYEKNHGITPIITPEAHSRYKETLYAEVANDLAEAFLIRKPEVPATQQDAHRPNTPTDPEFLRESGRKGGSKPKKNFVILAAVEKYLQDHPKKTSQPNRTIANSFRRKYNSTNPITVEFDGSRWDVYCDGEKICSTINGSNGKKSSYHDKHIKFKTFLDLYIPLAKKATLPSKS